MRTPALSEVERASSRRFLHASVGQLMANCGFRVIAAGSLGPASNGGEWPIHLVKLRPQPGNKAALELFELQP